MVYTIRSGQSQPVSQLLSPVLMVYHPTITGIDAGHYFSDDGYDDSSHADTMSAADVNHFPTAANANADVHTVLSQPTASYATMLWEGEDDASDDTDQHTAFQAAMAW